MKRLILTIASLLIVSIQCSFAQKSESKAILKVIINNYCSDSLFVSAAFMNDELLKDLEEIKTSKDYDIVLKSLADSSKVSNTLAQRNDDSLTIVIEHVQIAYFPSTKRLTRQNGKKISYACANIGDRKEQHASLKISTPIISIDNTQALVYTQYHCGPLCGSGGIIHLINTPEGWKIQNTSLRWIS